MDERKRTSNRIVLGLIAILILIFGLIIFANQTGFIRILPIRGDGPSEAN